MAAVEAAVWPAQRAPKDPRDKESEQLGKRRAQGAPHLAGLLVALPALLYPLAAAPRAGALRSDVPWFGH